MHEVTFRVEPGGPYGAPTAGTDATVELWCNDHCDLLAVRDDPGGAVLDAIAAQVGIHERVSDGGRTVAVTEECLRGRQETVEGHLARHSCLLVPPLRYAEGAKFCRVVGLAEGDLSAVYRDLTEEGPVTVESKRRVKTPPVERPLLTVADVLPSLSPRQRETLRLAHERGYYRVPREVTTADLADELGVERRTAEEHLRRAENKLVDATVEYLTVQGDPSSAGRSPRE